MQGTRSLARRRTARQFAQPGIQALRELRSSSALVTGPGDPRSLSADICLTKTFEYTASATSVLPVNFTPALLASNVPGGSAVFTRMRLVKVSAYAPASAAASVILVFADDEARFIDRGTQGALRPQLHVAPSFQTRNNWKDSSDASTIFTVGTTLAAATEIVVQATLELRSVPDVA